MANNYVKVNFDRVDGQSDMSVFIEIDGETYNIPNSQIADKSGFEHGDKENYVVIPEWLADSRGLMDYAEEY